MPKSAHSAILDLADAVRMPLAAHLDAIDAAGEPPTPFTIFAQEAIVNAEDVRLEADHPEPVDVPPWALALAAVAVAIAAIATDPFDDDMYETPAEAARERHADALAFARRRLGEFMDVLELEG